jgi:hypothetical protein
MIFPCNGFVCPNVLYSLKELKECLKIKDSTLRAARRCGLQVYYQHGRGYVLGEDWIGYVCSSSVARAGTVENCRAAG